MPPILSKHIPRNPDKEAFVEKQLRESKDNSHLGCKVTCGCGHSAPMRFMYRCYYCGQWYCFTCAAIHFGATREEYYQDPLARFKLTFTPNPAL